MRKLRARAPGRGKRGGDRVVYFARLAPRTHLEADYLSQERGGENTAHTLRQIAVPRSGRLDRAALRIAKHAGLLGEVIIMPWGSVSCCANSMSANASIRFFDEQFQRQIAAGELQLNPFESAALPHLRGKVLDYGCGLGNLSVAAARQGCSVVAFDASRAAIEHLRSTARRDGLKIEADEADLRTYELKDDYDAIVCIGLLMFFDCPAAFRQLSGLQAHVRPGGTLVVNVLTEGTTYMDMFSPEGHCLFKPGYLRERLRGWELTSYERQEFAAPRDTIKIFETAVAKKP